MTRLPAIFRLLALTLLLVAGGAGAAGDLRLGVLVYRGKDVTIAEWTAHADYLSARLAPRRVALVPLTLEEVPAAISARSIDFLVTNTGHYVELEAAGSISRFATMRMAGPDGPVDRFGGTAVTLAERTELNNYADLAGQRVATPSRSGFGGWQVHQREALRQNVRLEKTLGRIIETGSQDAAIAKLLAGEVDAAFVRSDLIESMAAAGRLDLSRLRIINPVEMAGYPYRLSTRLYPHWPFARLRHVDEELTRDVLTALLQMTAGDRAARAAGIHSWTVGHNYQPVHDMFIELRLPPYDKLQVTMTDIMERYGAVIIVAGSAVILILLGALWISWRSERELQGNQARLRLAAGVFEHAQEGILITDTQGIIIDANGTFLQLTGYARDEIIGRNPNMLSSGKQDPAFYQAMWQELATNGTWRGELWNRRKDGSLYVQRTSISAVRDAAGQTTHYIGLSYDVTALRESQDQLEHMAYYDALTGLPNRRLLADRLQQAISQAARTERLLAICYLDLDGFKPINDNWGHAAGDRLLVEAAARLNSAVRSGDTISRLGGDEFVVLLGNLNHIDECEMALERIRAALGAPYLLSEGEATLSASIGVTLYPLDGAEPDMLIRHADQAMYVAKQSGRNRYQLFDAGTDKLSEAQLESLAALRQAIDHDEFLLHYQPKVDMRSSAVIGAEALLRWQHPERGLLYPGEFLPVVDFVGLQNELGAWVLRAAIRQIAAWSDAGLRLAVSINVAAEQLQQADFVSDLGALLAEFPAASPDLVELELLETAALHDLTAVAGVIDQCRNLGVHFAIDDFGTGYSSLTYLKQLHARTLKIDQTFVRDMLEDPEDLAIVDGVISLAASFRREVVAEGVETPAHGVLLLQLGCHLAQGYGIARPMPPAALGEWISHWQPPSVWRDIRPWPREDLPLLTMAVDHRRWYADFVAAIEADDPRDPANLLAALPPLDPHQCRVGRWLDNEGRRRYQHIPAFSHIDVAHDRVHVVGAELAELARTDQAAARARLPELARSRDELLHALEELRVMVIGYHE